MKILRKIWTLTLRILISCILVGGQVSCRISYEIKREKEVKVNLKNSKNEKEKQVPEIKEKF
jgi:ribosomal protein S4